MPAPTNLPIERKRGDTRRIIYVVKDSDKAVINISLWTAFLLTVDPAKRPLNAINNVFQISGVFETDGTDGRIGFTPPGNSATGNYFYDVQALDSNGEKTTVAEGKYKLTEDITKD